MGHPLKKNAGRLADVVSLFQGGPLAQGVALGLPSGWRATDQTPRYAAEMGTATQAETAQ